MIEPGLATADSLAAARNALRAGTTTLHVNDVAEAALTARGAHSNFKLVPGYRHMVCASVNADVVHGIPNNRVLQPGDIISIDSGAEIDGWNGDAAFTVVLPDEANPDVVADRQQLSDITEQSLWHGIARLARARYLNEVGDEIQGYIESQGDYGILTDYVGHGIGRTMHEEPPVFNYRVRERGPEVKPGLVVAIEPMVVAGSPDTFIQDDDWTVTTADGKSAAHWEHSVAVHKDGIWVLTSHDGGASALKQFGITPVPIG